MGVESVASVQIDKLIGVLEVAVRKEHGCAEEAIAEEGAAVTAAHERAGDVRVEAAAIVGEKDAARVRRAIERASAHERCESTYGNVWERWIDRRSERIAGEGLGYRCVEIGVRAGGTEAVTEICVERDFESA